MDEGYLLAADFLNDTLYDAQEPADDWLWEAALAIDETGSGRSSSPKLHLTKNFLRRMPSNTINSYRNRKK